MIWTQRLFPYWSCPGLVLSNHLCYVESVKEMGIQWGAVLGLFLVLGCTKTQDTDTPTQNNNEQAEADKIPAPTHLPDQPKVTGPRIDAASIPKEPAFVGLKGKDKYGYPLRQPDKVAILNLLRLKRFDQLEKWMTHYQDEFEKNYRKENWPDIAVSAFYVADPKLGELLDKWVEQSPEHFAPWVARGNYRFKVGQHYRGGKYARYTSLAQFTSMKQFSQAATEDFEQAVKIRPKLVAAHRRMLQTAKSIGRDPLLYLKAAIKQCRLCYIPRRTYMYDLTPRWGGSHEQMHKFVRQTKPLMKKNPKLSILRGFVNWDRCRTLGSQKMMDKAIKACDAAIKMGEAPDFLTIRAALFDRKTEQDRAIPYFDRALRIEPQHRSALPARVFAKIRTKDLIGASKDLAVARSLEPTDDHTAKQVKWLVEKLRYEGSVLYKDGKYEKAESYFSAGLQLSPDDNNLRKRSAWAQKKMGGAGMEKQLTANPNGYDIRLKRDHLLSSQYRYDEVVKMWDEYIQSHADDPRPYMERAGAKWHLGLSLESVADMQKACDLGLDKACTDMARMKSMIGK
jgi:tetratricopeptide (TPR) repeat protein